MAPFRTNKEGFMIINNKLKSVIVLKAAGMLNLRLFPGYNQVQENGIKKYFTSPAAKAHQKENLIIVESEKLTAEDRIQADKAKEKNDLLNRAQHTIKIQNEKVKKGDQIISDQAKIIKELQADMKRLKAINSVKNK